MTTEYLIYESAVNQIAGLVAERDALAAALAASHAQKDALLDERAALRNECDVVGKALAFALAQADKARAERDAIKAEFSALREMATSLIDATCTRETADKWRRAYLGDIMVDDDVIVFEVSGATDDGAEEAE